MSPSNTALAALYQAHARRELHAFARRRLGRQEAEDVVQDAYLHLLQRGSAATLEHPRPYLFPIWRWILPERPRSVCATRARTSNLPAMPSLRRVPNPPPQA